MTARLLSATDRYFVSQECVGYPMVIGALLVVDTLGASSREVLRVLSEHLAESIQGSGLLKVLRTGEEGMAWIEADYYSSPYHMCAIRGSLDSPSAVTIFIEKIARRALDLRRPPFAIWIIENMGDGRAGIVIRVHHGFADGAAFLSILSELTDSDCKRPLAGRGSGCGLPPERSEYPSALAPYRLHATNAADEAPNNITDCSYALASFQFSALQRAAGVLGGTLNVLLLALLAQAVRDICNASGMSIPQQVVVRVAANIRKPGEDSPGNKIEPIDLYLGTNISDLSDRFTYLQTALSGASSAVRAGYPAPRLDAPEALKASFAGVLGWSKSRLLGGLPVLHNFPIPMLTPRRFLSMGLRRCGDTLDVALMTRNTSDFTSGNILARLSSAMDYLPGP